MTVLYIVATPIGNLEDIGQRALRILKEVDLILCEDTRTTKKLLEHYQIKTPTLSYHQHSKLKKVDYILNLLKQGKKLALVSDAGTPGISDPGGKLIKAISDAQSYFSKKRSLFREVRKSNGCESYGKEIQIVPIPGPSALMAAASISGFPMDKFVFLGFPPAKKKRKKFFKEIANSKCPVIFYESPHRIIKTLNEIEFTQIGGKIRENSRDIVVCRELTKKFETIYRGKIAEIIEEIKKDKVKGEFAIVVDRK